MMKFKLLASIILLPLAVKCQQIALTHTGTQFDAFENPVQRSFQTGLSRKYAINLLPAANIFLYFKGGSAESAFKKLIFTRSFYGRDIKNLGAGETNHLNLNGGFYLFSFRIFKTVKYNRELGFSLKFNEEANVKITNESLALVDSYQNFQKSTYSGILNNKGFNQSYWQLSANYRENHNDRWAFGGKISLLSGLTYNKINTESSQLQINSDGSYDTYLKGSYKSSFGNGDFHFRYLYPNLRNVGLGISGGTSYTSKKGAYLTFNIKDLGFIHWSKNSSVYKVDNMIHVDAGSNNSYNQFFNEFGAIIDSTESKKGFSSPINTKIELAGSQTFDFYTPVFVISKSAFQNEGQIALLNNFKKNAFIFSINGIYDLNTKWNLGTQLLIKSPNAEFYIGSEQVLPSYQFVKGYLKKDGEIGSGIPRANFYIGLNVKFGRKMQTIGNADEYEMFIPKQTKQRIKKDQKKENRN